MQATLALFSLRNIAVQMRNTKPAAFDPRLVRAAKLAKALAHPARLAILRVLVEQKGCVSGPATIESPLSPATLAQHLRELKIAGLIQGTLVGPRSSYCINPQGWEEAKSFFGDLFEQAEPETQDFC